ncbi:ParA family protein (plasmid) [Iamia sp. SCSIO 61187]|uniref:ParA family protein n=1 Tax=Iamia sp. SCSIO 61187 TaxID=2722752 RepID=UPI001C62F1D0|nr:ParA family protein [Iamia sp. SCSIO 61187]QYG95832.1 ParA family protein [Iamia sp. SCSIO 61187]
MTVLSIVSRKGGVGKTTTAIYLARALAQTGPTLLVDADPDHSALSWSEGAPNLGPDVIALPVADLARRVESHRAHYDHIVIDTPPGAAHAPQIDGAIMAADVAVIPCPPQLGDIDRLAETVAMVERVGAVRHVPYVVLLTRVRSGTRAALDAGPALTDAGHPVLAAQIPMRERIGLSFGAEPVAVPEYDAALTEILALEATPA